MFKSIYERQGFEAFSPNYETPNPYHPGVPAYKEWQRGYDMAKQQQTEVEPMDENNTQTTEFSTKGCLACGGLILIALILILATILGAVYLIWG